MVDDEMVPAGGGARGNEGAVVEVGVTLCLRRVCLYFCRICEENTQGVTQFAQDLFKLASEGTGQSTYLSIRKSILVMRMPSSCKTRHLKFTQMYQ